MARTVRWWSGANGKETKKILPLPVSRWGRQRRAGTHVRTPKIAEPVDVSKPAEYRNYSLRCTLYSRFLCVIRSPFPGASPIFRPSSSPLSPGSSFLSAAPWTTPGPASLSTADLLYLGWPAATLPPLCVNSCTYRQHAGYLQGKGPRSRATFTLHNARQSLFPLSVHGSPGLILSGADRPRFPRRRILHADGLKLN